METIFEKFKIFQFKFLEMFVFKFIFTKDVIEVVQRHTLNLNSHKYLIEYINSAYESLNDYTVSKYVMLRNFNIVNDIVVDTDILFIDKASFREIIEELQEKDVTDIQVFPLNNSKMTGYSKLFSDFNSNIYKEYLVDSIKDNIIDKDSQYVYSLFERASDDSFVEKSVKNNIVRIYHPTTQISLDGIICIKNIMNDINIYYLCKRFDRYESHSETEINIDNNKYSEYIEVAFPNIEDLFGIDNNKNGLEKYSTFYIDNLNVFAHDVDDNFNNVQLVKDIIDSDHQYIPLNLLIQPYKIRDAYVDKDNNISFEPFDDLRDFEKMFIKEYFDIKKSIHNNHIIFPVTLLVFPYEESNENVYQLQDNSSIGNIQMGVECKIQLSSKLGFSNGRISLINKFIYPESHLYSDVKEAYISLNNVTVEEYDDFYGSSLDERIGAIAYNDISELELDVVKNLLKREKTAVTTNTILEKYRQLLKEQILEDYDDEFNTSTNFIGFRIEISSDNIFKNLVYEKEIYCKLSDLADFNFEINGIIEDWNNRPDRLICRTIFIDKYLGLTVVSNFVVITKEWFKYIINNEYNIFNLSELDESNKEYDVMLNKEQKEIVLNKDNVNFINNIRCVVSKINEDNTDNRVHHGSQKVVFKPIFYKVQTLQNIQIRQTVKQNIGINLSEYMTKVETFKLLIDNSEIVESSRNDMYVIFAVDGKKISNYTGKYDIVNQDDEYISSGNWTLT